MKDPARPDTTPDEYLPEAPGAHQPPKVKAVSEGVNPIDTSSMPRGEDDERTRRDSPEFHDRPDAPARPDKP